MKNNKCQIPKYPAAKYSSPNHPTYSDNNKYILIELCSPKLYGEEYYRKIFKLPSGVFRAMLRKERKSFKKETSLLRRIRIFFCKKVLKLKEADHE